MVCTLSGEDIFLDKLHEPFKSQAMAALRERAAEVDAFVSLNHYYADFMADYLAVPRARIEVIPHGLKLAGHGTRQTRADEPFTIGYLARICPDKGLHNLIAAAELLAADPSTPPFRIRAAGYMADADRHYLETIQKRVASWPNPAMFGYAGELTRAEKIAFLESLDCMSLPTVYRESKGISVLEALANAVPVVLPRHGTFPELVEQTGGGVLHAPDDPAALAMALTRLAADRQAAAELGLRGQAAIRRDYEADGMARRTLDLYRRLQTTARR